uniref:Uncharacterized protein n=1 Tax=Tetranychus urticae TaxID=32264 RepID=T1KV53_TETUR
MGYKSKFTTLRIKIMIIDIVHFIITIRHNFVYLIILVPMLDPKVSRIEHFNGRMKL